MYFQTDESGRWLPQPRPQGQFYLQNQSLFGGAQVAQPFQNHLHGDHVQQDQHKALSLHQNYHLFPFTTHQPDQPIIEVPHQNINLSSVAPMPMSCVPIYNTMMEEPKLEELEEFAETIKQKRISLGLSQVEVSSSMRKLYEQGVSHETLSRFENLNMSFRNMCKLKPWLQKWLTEVRVWPTNPSTNTTHSSSPETIAQRKHKTHKRTYFKKEVRDALEKAFSQDPKPSNTEIVSLAQNLGMKTKVVRVWFFNRRHKEKKVNGTPIQPRKMHTAGYLPSAALERAFNQKPYPTTKEVDILSESLGIENERVRYWFYNRRRKEKKNLSTLDIAK